MTQADPQPAPRRSIEPTVAILDDIFPHPLSAFRYEEFLCYLEAIPGCVVCSTGESFALIKEPRTLESVIDSFLASYPVANGRVGRLRAGTIPVARSYYTIFINNIVKSVSAIEQLDRPFAFTLYPGGGFQIDDKTSDAKLHRVLSSPCFRHVIVTQPITRDYLLSRFSLSPTQMTFIAGGVMPRSHFAPAPERARLGSGRHTPRIGFIANRYMPGGFDKGYDLFLHTAEALVDAGIQAHFHVVGPWSAEDLPVAQKIENCLTFHGYLETGALTQLSRTLDLILSPNRPNRLFQGGFDGFPTGSCIEAGLQGAAIFCTDELKLNTQFVDGTDIVLVRPDIADIVDKVVPYLQRPEDLARLGECGRAALLRCFGHEAQMAPRLSVLNRLLSGEDRPSVS